VRELPRGPGGGALCRQCSVEVAPPRRTFCSDRCVDEWKIRTQPGFAKLKVFERDEGICQLCRVDCVSARVRQRLERGERVSKSLKGQGWHMDHIVPVAEGGGSCGLDNLRTLCIPCHRIVTADLKRRLALKRRRARA
jgi:5-methylcytosine-specific restriction endonuclease McrA